LVSYFLNTGEFRIDSVAPDGIEKSLDLDAVGNCIISELRQDEIEAVCPIESPVDVDAVVEIDLIVVKMCVSVVDFNIEVLML
jgi:hypothetical protein